MRNGAAVAEFEAVFAEYVGARYAIALCNGTATLHTALVALGVMPGDRVAVPPLTMSATTIAVLHAGAVPVFVDVDPNTWLMDRFEVRYRQLSNVVAVSLYGAHYDLAPTASTIDDAAQTLRPHDGRNGTAFTSYSFQASKILPLGEGGMLVTDDEDLATRARGFSSLGYRMRADQPRIDPALLKSPTYERHHTLGWNYRMSDHVAAVGLRFFEPCGAMYNNPEDTEPRIEVVKRGRLRAAAYYRDAVAGCDWLTPQHVPDGWGHDYWTYAVAADTPERATELAYGVAWNGGERPYSAWRLTYQEPAFRHLAPDGTCPVAEDLQPRILQFQTNNIVDAERNAEALRRTIAEM